MKLSLSKFNKKTILIIGSIILVFSLLGVLAISFTSSKGYVMFIYTRDNPSAQLQVAEVKSGYTGLISCQQAGGNYNYSIKGKQMSLFHCATGCPLYAETEQDCKQHD